MTLLLLFVPNELKARVIILICGGVVVFVGGVLHIFAKRPNTTNTA